MTEEIKRFLDKAAHAMEVAEKLKEDDYPSDSASKVYYAEGFIVYSMAVYGGFLMVTLTAKGLSVLNSVPGSLRKKAPLSKRISAALKKGGAGMISVTIQEVLKVSASVAWKNYTGI
jgi:hypothetical protein